MLIGPLFILEKCLFKCFARFSTRLIFVVVESVHSPHLLNVKPKALPELAQPTFHLVSDYPLHHGSQLGATLHADVWQV